MRRWLVLLAVLAVSACSAGSPDQPQVASAVEGGGATPTSTQDVLTQYVSGVRTYVQCMREHGVNLPDPGPRGEVDYSGLGPGNFKLNPQYQTASSACAQLYPPMPEELQDKTPMTPEQIEYARRYARCMRDNGVPDFPDPDADGFFSRGVGATTEQAAAALARAGQICEPLLQGGPTGTPNPNATGGQG